MRELDPHEIAGHFGRTGTVEQWWAPDSGPLAFHYEAELDVLEDHLTVDAGSHVLDVGTGRGRFGAWFAQQGCSVVGVDRSPEMLDHARNEVARLGLQDRFYLVCCGAEDLSSLGNTRFDVVACMELFDHLPDLDAALAQMTQHLRPGGRLLFTYVPSESLYGCLGNGYRHLQRGLGRGRTLISRTYRLEEVRRRLARQGLFLERFWGIGLLCLNAQTRLFADNPLANALNGLARLEASRHAYYASPWIARHGAHVVGLARHAGS